MVMVCLLSGKSFWTHGSKDIDEDRTCELFGLRKGSRWVKVPIIDKGDGDTMEVKDKKTKKSREYGPLLCKIT